MKRLLWAALLLLPALAGCGPGQAPVSGRVLLNGTPLPAGRVTFRPADPRQNSVSAELDEQGRFSTVLPVGDVKVCVDNREWEPQEPIVGVQLPAGVPAEVRKSMAGANPPGKTRPSPKYVPLPERYYDLETSGLGFAVPRGGLSKDIELTK
jgi:hypothetical protein